MELDYRNPISMEEYSKSSYIETETEDWSDRTTFSQLIDVWGKLIKH